MKRTGVSIPCGEIKLEGILQFPDGEGPFPAVIVCHPHPLHGANLHNNVVAAVGRELVGRSFAVLRFNFRGVGQSGGTHGEGIGEQADVRAAIDFILSQKNIDTDKLGLAGYSFGGGVVLPVAFNDKRVKSLVLIAPAIMENGWGMLQKYLLPKLLITGSDDGFFPVVQFEANFELVPEPKQFIVIKGADHFWQGYESQVATRVGEFFTQNLR